jgi:4-carboxymuconolactone decarboxylase
MSRYREIPPEDMNGAQSRIRDEIVAGKRGSLRGPFTVLIQSPEICGHAARLGEHLRWGTSLAPRLSELAICITARFWRAQYEWFAHAPLAVKAGVPAAAIEAIRRGETPHFAAADEALVHRLCQQIYTAHRLDDASFAEAVAAIGEVGIIEIIAIVGYYTLIGNTLNVFQVALPEGETPPFPE